MSGVITYKIVNDKNGKLKKTAKIACNFWNHFLTPKSAIIIRLGVFTQESTTIARAYKPYQYAGNVYGVVEFNTKYLDDYTDYDTAGTIIHEIGHTLGFGWDTWMTLFHKNSGRFKEEYAEEIAALQDMLVETDYGAGTRFSHWDEETFDEELMTGFKDRAEHVLPVTISVMKLLGHVVNEELQGKQRLEELMMMYEAALFSRTDEVKLLDLAHFEKTDVWEEVFTASKP